MGQSPQEVHYDLIYSKADQAFGESGKPQAIVARLPHYLKSGTILELGAGQGRNGLWLARLGFQVEARELSQTGVNAMNKAAADEALPFHAIRSDARDALLEIYDAVISTYMLHHLRRKDAQRVIAQIQLHTKPCGFNVLTVFTKQGDFFQQDPTTDSFYPEAGELRSIYADWEVLVLTCID